MQKGSEVKLISIFFPVAEKYLEQFINDIGVVHSIDEDDVLVDWQFGAQTWVKKEYLSLIEKKDISFYDKKPARARNVTDRARGIDMGATTITIPSLSFSSYNNIVYNTDMSFTTLGSAPRYVSQTYVRRESPSASRHRENYSHGMTNRPGGIPAPQSMTVIRRRGER